MRHTGKTLQTNLHLALSLPPTVLSNTPHTGQGRTEDIRSGDITLQGRPQEFYGEG